MDKRISNTMLDESVNPYGKTQPEKVEVEEEKPDLSKRKMRCYYQGCKHQIPSDPKAPSFKHQPEQEYDSFYCWCHGFA